MATPYSYGARIFSELMRQHDRHVVETRLEYAPEIGRTLHVQKVLPLARWSPGKRARFKRLDRILATLCRLGG